MEVQNITLSQVAAPGAVAELPHAMYPQVVAVSPSPTKGPSAVAGTNDASSINWSTPLFHKIYEDKTALNSAADTVKHTNSALNAAGTIISKMRQQLDGIVKNYPPFPPGDTQRMKYLEGFMSLRKELEQLTFPSDNGRLAATIPALPTNPADDTSDAPIHEALSSLDSAAGMIAAQRQRLNSDYHVMLARATDSAPNGAASIQSTTVAAFMPEYGAAQKSRYIQNVLTTTSAGLSASDNSLLKNLS